MTLAINLSGETFHRLTAIKRSNINTPAGKAIWICKCACGVMVEATSGHLKSGHTKSCGCAKVDRLKKEKYVTHGHARKSGHSTTYQTWHSMLARCSLKAVKLDKNYGGRGIAVCDRWLTFENFLADMGEKPHGLEIDRKDNNGNYEPDNCKWSTPKENCRNRRSNHFFEFDGKSLTISQWAEETGLNKHTIRGRMKKGWTPVDVFSPPNKHLKRASKAVGLTS